jgi:hypothetical protein
MKITCPEHDESFELDDDYVLLIHGKCKTSNVNYIAELTWCKVVKANVWFELIKNVIKNDPLFDSFWSDMICYDYSDPLFSAIEFIVFSNACCCPERVKAYHVLNINLGNFDITSCLQHVLNYKCDEDLDDNDLDDKINYEYKKECYDTIKYFYGKFTKSFYHFVLNRMMETEDDKKNENILLIHKISKESNEVSQC